MRKRMAFVVTLIALFFLTLAGPLLRKQEQQAAMSYPAIRLQR